MSRKSAPKASHFTTVFFFLVAGLCLASGNEEVSSGIEIDLVYGYRYPDSFMAEHLQDMLKDDHILKEEGIGYLSITYSSGLREIEHNKFAWDHRLVDPDRLKTMFAAEDCSVDAVSLHSASLSRMTRYGIEDRIFREIDRESLEKYAPNYFEVVLVEKEGERLHRRNHDDPWYALTGYRYVYEKGEFLVATTVQDYETVHKYEPMRSIPQLELRLSSAVDIGQLEDDLKRNKIENPSGVPFLAWRNFEYSFAPLYSAFGIRTVGDNLTNISVDGVPNVDDYPVHVHPFLFEFVKFLRGWYEAGLIDSDFLTVDYGKARERAKSGKYAYLSTPRGATIVRPNWLFRSFYDATLSPISLFQVTKDGHTEQSYHASPFIGAEAYLWCVPDNKIGPLLRVFEYTRWPGSEWYPDRNESPGWMKRVFGLLDTHYQVEGDRISPYKVRSVDPNDDPRFSGDRDPDHYAMWHFKVVPEITLSWAQEKRLLQFGFSSQIEPHDEPLLGDPFRGPRELGAIVGKLYEIGYERHEVAELLDSLSRLTMSNVERWIIGAASIEDEWEGYVANWKTSPAGAAIISALGR